MRDSYEPSSDHRPWQARRPEWPDHPAYSRQPAVPPAGSPARLPDWAGHDLNQFEEQPPEPSGPPGPSPADWAAHDPYLRHPDGPAADGRALERRPPYWLAYDPYQYRPPVSSRPPYPPRPAPSWGLGWADYDPYSGYPVWPGHPAYATRNAGLRRLSKLTWRAAEVSAVIAVGFVALFARMPHGGHASVKPAAKLSAHASATHHAHKRHKHHRHHAIAPAPALAPPAAPPAAAPPPPPPPPPPAPPPPPPPPPVTTSGGSGGG
jgi:hypothetical protein